MVGQTSLAGGWVGQRLTGWSMDWTIIAAVGELAGAIGVIASLIYVGRQVREANVRSRLAARHEFMTGVTAFTMGIAANPELSRAFAKVHFEDFGRGDASPEERIQIAYAVVAFVGQINLAYEQMKEGVMSPDELESLFGSGTALMTRPYIAEIWPILRPTFPDDFARWFATRYGLTGVAKRSSGDGDDRSLTTLYVDESTSSGSE